MSQAFISWLSLATSDKFFQDLGRLSTVWFDEIVLQIPSGDMLENVFDTLVSRREMENHSAEYLLKCWKPVHKVLPGHNFLGINSDKNWSNPWGHSNRHLVELAEQIVRQETKADYPEVDESSPGFLHEVAMAGAGLINAVDTWLQLNEVDATSLIANNREDAVISGMIGKQDPSDGFDAFLSIMERRSPDISNLTWERAIELREHKYLAAFQSKVRDLQQAVKSHSAADVTSMMRELEEQDLKQIARLTEPSMRSTLIKAVASNIPLPIPINPISIYTSSADVAHAQQMAKQYGWLYFLLDVEKT